ncbi:Hypothetical_protein [Hexamita inflata]|uniref:Hypothetical_protein n=1 Tax=Hexamita inflata TaxID=28002 RepID=A0AA86QUK5_9EUKA|nr:Hypothetical protein HINF_LOCUS53946 [Hexamita inflata]
MIANFKILRLNPTSWCDVGKTRRGKWDYPSLYSFHFLETAQTDFIETFESKTWALATQCFHFQNGLNPSFMPTQQRPNRALTESLADQFHRIRQLTFQKLVLASQFLFARYFLRLAREVDSLYWHCLVVVAFDASFHQLDQVPRILFRLYIYISLPRDGTNERL